MTVNKILPTIWCGSCKKILTCWRLEMLYVPPTISRDFCTARSVLKYLEKWNVLLIQMQLYKVFFKTSIMQLQRVLSSEKKSSDAVTLKCACLEIMFVRRELLWSKSKPLIWKARTSRRHLLAEKRAIHGVRHTYIFFYK